MHDPVQLRMIAFEIGPQRLDFLGPLKIADVDGGPGHQLFQLLLAGQRADRKDHPCPGLEQYAGHMPRHALAVGHPHHQHRLARQLQKIHYCFPPLM